MPPASPKIQLFKVRPGHFTLKSTNEIICTKCIKTPIFKISIVCF